MIRETVASDGLTFLESLRHNSFITIAKLWRIWRFQVSCTLEACILMARAPLLYATRCSCAIGIVADSVPLSDVIQYRQAMWAISGSATNLPLLQGCINLQSRHVCCTTKFHGRSSEKDMPSPWHVCLGCGVLSTCCRGYLMVSTRAISPVITVWCVSHVPSVQSKTSTLI